VSGNKSRRSGKTGEREAKKVLLDRDWEVDDLTDGTSCADFIATTKTGKVYAVEVKHHKSINIPAFVSQARSQAGRKRWLLMAHIYGTSSWLVYGADIPPTVWREKKKG
jgi:hypothetical protein